MIWRLHPDYPELFPDPEEADPEGLVAVGGDLSVRRLLAAEGELCRHSGVLLRNLLASSRGTAKDSRCSGGPPIPGA